jgi:hypothetical protein
MISVHGINDMTGRRLVCRLGWRRGTHNITAELPIVEDGASFEPRSRVPRRPGNNGARSLRLGWRGRANKMTDERIS